MQDTAATRSDAGLGALFDFNFSTFITLGVMKVLYMLGILLIALGWLIGVVSGFFQGILMGLLGLVVVSILALIYLILFRVSLELIVVVFRIGENTSKLVQAKQAAPLVP